MLPIFEFIDENVIGSRTSFEGPYGKRRGMIRGRSYRYIVRYDNLAFHDNISTKIHTLPIC